MKHILLVLMVMTTMVTTSVSQIISSDQAARVAIAFMEEHKPAQEGFPGWNSLDVSGSFAIMKEDTPLYYLFNLTPDGWIAISADIRLHPVLAYSFEGTWDPGNQAPAFKAWMQQYQDQIWYAKEENKEGFALTRVLWERYQADGRTGGQAEGRTGGVEPLITSSWNQSPWYNEMCPADPLGPHGHCVAGCVPVCMAQVMYYFRWPETGTGSYAYTEPNYGVLSADFGATTYQWDEMTDAISSSNPAMATLIYHLGVSCDLQYGPNGSGMYNHKAAYSLRTFFKYSPQTQYLFRDSTSLDWDSVLIAHLDRKIPMYYAGWDDPWVSGHAFVCDGYQDSCYFHFNFGWGGNSDGYFYTSDLTPGGYNFNLAQEVVINCYPDTVNYTWPVQCSGNKTLVNKVGSIEDGSGPVDPYLPTANCSWLIAPQTLTDSVSSITVSFKRFDTNPGDQVTLYDGGTTLDPVIGQFSGDQLPPAVTSNTNQVLITFEASGNMPENGFYASYKANQPVWCSGTTAIKADTADFTDGSFDFDYYNNSLCKWKLESASGDTLTIHFRSFDTEPEKDFLTIFDLVTGDTLACLSGYYTPENLPDSVTAPGGKMFLIFNTNSSVTANGWEIFYPKKTNTGIRETNTIQHLRIFPNPASGEATLEFTSQKQDQLWLEILTTDGRLQQKTGIHGKPGKNSIDLNLHSFEPGLYLIRITGTYGILYEKIIIQ